MHSFNVAIWIRTNVNVFTVQSKAGLGRLFYDMTSFKFVCCASCNVLKKLVTCPIKNYPPGVLCILQIKVCWLLLLSSTLNILISKKMLHQGWLIIVYQVLVCIVWSSLEQLPAHHINKTNCVHCLECTFSIILTES